MSFSVLLLGLVLLSTLAPGQGPAGASAPLALDKPVLLLIDIQNFYFEGGRIPLVGPVEAGLKAAQVLGAFRARKLRVIHFQHMPKGTEKFEPGKTDAQYAIHKSVAPTPGEAVIVKHFANAFRETRLAEVLKAAGARTLVIAGMQTHMCVEAAVRAGADLGYAVVLVEDACATRNLKFGEVNVPAGHVQAAVLAALGGTYARIITAAEAAAALK